MTQIHVGYCRNWLYMVFSSTIGSAGSSLLPKGVPCLNSVRAKCFQTIVRLGTHTLKVPTYNSLKALKGAMFYLPLPLEKTMETYRF